MLVPSNHEPADSERRPELVLPRFSLARRITVLVLLVTVLVVGAIATIGIPLELIPRGFDQPFLVVRTIWPDAGAQETLDKVALPLEEELSTVGDLDTISAFVAGNGFTRVFMRFKSGADMDVAYREVRDRIERAKPRLPEEVDRLLIEKHDDAAIPVFMTGLAIDPEITDPYNLIQNSIILPLSRIDGVATVQADGLEEKEVLIELDRERTTAAGLNVWQLGQELAGDNFTMASGDVYAGGKKLLLRSVATYDSVESLENRLVAPSVRLKDVATVSYALPDTKYRARAMSKPAIALLVFKEGEANAVAVAQEVNRVVEEMRQDPRLASIEIATFFNQAEVIRSSLSTLLDAGRIGGLIAIVVLFFFLRRFRMTLIITLSIPLSLLLALVVMYFTGETLNIITLLALMISVGLLVDNSVVVAENIFRLHKEGMSRREACIRGAGEISLAVVMATLTTIIVFLPVSLVEGQGQFFLLRLSVPITVALAGSLFVALVFVPLAVYMTLPSNGGTRSNPVGRRVQGMLRFAYERSFEPVNHGYNKVLGFFLRRRLDLTMAIVAVLAVTGGIASQVDLVQVQEEEQAQFEIDVDLPQTTTLEEAEEYFLAVEKILETKQDEYGLEGYFIFHRSTFGEVQGWLRSERESKLTAREVTEAIVELLPEQAGVRIFTGQESQVDDASQAEHVFTLYGEDPTELETVALQLEDFFIQIDGVLGVKKGNDRPNEELALVVDRDRTQNLGINPEVVAGVVGYALRGSALPEFYRDGKEIPVRIRYEEEDREGLDELADFQVPTSTGASVSLASITDTERLPTSRAIYRRDKQIARTITFELEEGKEEETRATLIALSRGIDLPEGVRFGAPRTFGGDNEDVQAMLFAMALSVIFIYLLMGFLFESFILPLSILTTIPLAAIGVYWMHFIAGYDLDFLGLVGIVLLIGVVVNNGIVLIDYVNRLRAEGMARREAILLAADRRFRPIMMTALTTISGMIPLALGGATSIGISYTSFSLTLIGGLTTATLLTLLVVPVTYTLFDDLRGVLASVSSRALGRRPASAEG
ncbi:MAG: efflux RND transporter permease subunit [Acidobacteriota bacterium]